MRTETKVIEIYRFEELSKEAKEKVIDDFHTDGFYDYLLGEYIDSLKSLATKINADLNYSISLVEDRGEFIKLAPKYDKFDTENLKELLKNKDDCPLTGCCYDISLLDAIKENGMKSFDRDFLKTIHDEYSWHLEEDQIKETCEANEYEFYENGELYNE